VWELFLKLSRQSLPSLFGFQVYLYIGITLSVYNIASVPEICNTETCTKSPVFPGAKERIGTFLPKTALTAAVFICYNKSVGGPWSPSFFLLFFGSRDTI